jgi:signal transduction histidine kinase
MLKQEFGENKKIQRIEQSVQNVLDLQQHLRSYLHNHKQQKEKFELKTLLQNSINILQKNHPTITFNLDIDNTTLLTNKEAFSRIIDNLLSNAAKYNKQNGSININLKNSNLYMVDTGIGIKEPKKVFNRFYKEQERGIGIGLHIVKKLCEELNIKISLKSELDKGTTFILNISALTNH